MPMGQWGPVCVVRVMKQKGRYLKKKKKGIMLSVVSFPKANVC